MFLVDILILEGGLADLVLCVAQALRTNVNYKQSVFITYNLG